MAVVLLETPLWRVELFSDQAHLGRSVVRLKRDCGSVAGITADEWVELHTLIKRLERAFTEAFGATMFNWTCLMNNAYKRTPPTPLVHWHFRPRYREPVCFAGERFEDPEFAHHYDRQRHKEVSESVLERIAERVQPLL